MVLTYMISLIEFPKGKFIPLMRMALEKPVIDKRVRTTPVVLPRVRNGR